MNVLVFILLSSIISTDLVEEWILVKKIENIEVFSRKLDSEEFKEIKIIGQVECELSEIVLALEDIETQKEWVTRTMDAIELEKLGVGEYYYYVSTDLPFPIRDRDLVVHYKRTQDLETKVVHTVSRATPYRIDEKELFERIHEFNSTYKLTPQKNGWIKIEYYMKLNPGGALPAWLVNLAAAKGPLDTISSLYELIYSGRYQGLTAEGIID